MIKNGTFVYFLTPWLTLLSSLKVNNLVCFEGINWVNLKPVFAYCRRAGFFLVVAFCSTASFAVMVPPSNQDIELQIQFIDQEILLLRAELAQSNQDVPAFKRYLKQLNSLNLAPVFNSRFKALQAHSQFLIAQSKTESDGVGAVESKASYRFKQPSESSEVMVLLPLSGDYGEAGLAILDGLKTAWPLDKMFRVIDSGLYDSMNELWELVKLYQPDFIIGPLEKTKVNAWQSLDVQIPTLYLNQLENYRAHEKGVSPSKGLGLDQLKSFAETLGISHVLVLSDSSQGAQNLQSEFQQAWLKDGERSYESVIIENNVHQSMANALNVQHSITRKNWVQKTLDEELEFEPRARQDLEAVIYFSSIDEAIQIKPLLDFYHLNSAFSLWYPSTYPTAEELLSQQHNWQQTYAFLPPYLVQSNGNVNELPIQSSTHNVSSEQSSVSKSGLFYALGELVAEIVKNPRINLVNQPLAVSPLGALITNKDGRLSVLPKVFWLDDQQIQPVDEYQYPFD